MNGIIYVSYPICKQRPQQRELKTTCGEKSIFIQSFLNLNETAGYCSAPACMLLHCSGLLIVLLYVCGEPEGLCDSGETFIRGTQHQLQHQRQTTSTVKHSCWHMGKSSTVIISRSMLINAYALWYYAHYFRHSTSSKQTVPVSELPSGFSSGK